MGIIKKRSDCSLFRMMTKRFSNYNSAARARRPHCVTLHGVHPALCKCSWGGADFPRKFLWRLGLTFRLMSVGVEGDTKLFWWLDVGAVACLQQRRLSIDAASEQCDTLTIQYETSHGSRQSLYDQMFRHQCRPNRPQTAIAKLFFPWVLN